MKKYAKLFSLAAIAFALGFVSCQKDKKRNTTERVDKTFVYNMYYDTFYLVSIANGQLPGEGKAIDEYVELRQIGTDVVFFQGEEYYYDSYSGTYKNRPVSFHTNSNSLKFQYLNHEVIFTNYDGGLGGGKYIIKYGRLKEIK